MNKKDIQAGDIAFIDSNQIGAKIVKYFMRSPNLWVDIYRMITGTVKECEFYHPLVFVSKRRIAEQQKKVQYADANKVLQGEDKLIVFRPEYYFDDLAFLMKEINLDLGAKWGILHAFSRFMTWLTAIPYFARYVKMEDSEVSAGRVARWLWWTNDETFGHTTYTEATTQTMVQSMLNNPEEYKVVYKRG